MSDAKKILIVFPEDPSTTFLEEVISYLFQSVHSSLFTFLKINADDKSHQLTIEQIQNPIYNTIVFIGHGTSVALYGAYTSEYKNEKFITIKNFPVFDGKELLLVSCYSSSLLNRVKLQKFSKGMGFGDLPTDWNDIQSAREHDVDAYKGFTESTIETFRKCLIEIIKYSLSDFLNNNLELKELQALIVLRINKRIAKYYTENRIGNIPLSDALFKMKQEIAFF